MKNYGEGFCKWCGGGFIKNNWNQAYCSEEHSTHCKKCNGEYIFKGSPQWLKGVENKDTPYYCKDCKMILGRIKAKETKLKLYGDENYSNKEKARVTMIARYGAPTTLESEILIKKFEKTMIERYNGKNTKSGDGVLVNSASKRAKSQGLSLGESLYISKLFASEEKLNNWLKKYRFYKNKNKFSYGELSLELGVTVTELSHIFSKYFNLKEEYIRLKDSKLEIIVVRYIEENYNLIIKRRIKPVTKLEVDIYLPELELAFEVNDFATHSKESEKELLEAFKHKGTYKKGPGYHNNKTSKYKDIGIKLIHLWEDEIINGEYKLIIDEHLNL